jgi:hypothetical protein
MNGEHQGIINVEGVILFELNHRPRSREITDTSCQGAHHKVSVDPTLHDMGLLMFSSSQSASPCRIIPTARDL